MNSSTEPGSTETQKQRPASLQQARTPLPLTPPPGGPTQPSLTVPTGQPMLQIPLRQNVGNPPQPSSTSSQLLQLFSSQQSNVSSDSPSVLMHKSSVDGLEFLQKKARRANALRNAMLLPSEDTKTEKSARSVLEYARSRGSEDAKGMREANLESVNHAQVWRMAAVTVREGLLRKEGLPKITVQIAPYIALPSVIRPQSAIVWRDIYDVESAKNDELSICTRIEVAAAGRVAYNWLNNRHRTVISHDIQGYVEAVIDVIRSGRPRQHKSCAINVMQMCFGLPVDTAKPNTDAVMLLSDWIIYEHLEMRQHPQGKRMALRALMDHHNQVAMVHVRGLWGGDLLIAGQKRRRSEVLNYVTHGTVVFAHDEIRTCPCLVERIIRGMVKTTVDPSDVITCDEVLRKPGLVTYRTSRRILTVYVSLLFGCACLVITLSVKATSDGFEKVTGVLTGWSWSLALVSAVHFIVVKNLLPGTTLRHLAQGRRQASDLSDMRLSEGTLILLAQDARTNHLLAPGNACAYANRPSGTVQVSNMPSGLEAWRLGLVITDSFAIKLQQNTPLIRRTVENLDGSIHIEWDMAVNDNAVGRLLEEEVKVGTASDKQMKVRTASAEEVRDLRQGLDFGDDLC